VAHESGQAAGDGARVTSPVTVPGVRDAVEIVAGGGHTCARRAGGSVACWGLNRKGELGDGGTSDRSAPARVASIGDAQYLAGGRWHFCVVRRTGSVWCWGDNLGGQLGTGDVNDAANPVPVAIRNLPRG
jgi:alpha-tubulin suppressor-like RCC1 family protein